MQFTPTNYVRRNKTSGSRLLVCGVTSLPPREWEGQELFVKNMEKEQIQIEKKKIALVIRVPDALRELGTARQRKKEDNQKGKAVQETRKEKKEKKKSQK